MKISVVTAYYNRLTLFVETLKTMANSSIKDFEVIAVDDASDESQRIEPLVKEFPFLRVIRVNPEDRWYMNPCIPFNRAIAEATGDIVVLQNPECLHVGDVLEYIAKNANSRTWLSISTYAFNEQFTQRIRTEKRLPDFRKMPQGAFVGKMGIGWYNHPVYRPTYYHFCAAITKDNLDKLGGFDERYALGIAYDDNELVERVTRLGLLKFIATEVTVIHQHHGKNRGDMMKYRQMVERNRRLFELTKREQIIKVNNNYAKV